MKKYELLEDDSIKYDGHTLYRIRALKDLEYGVDYVGIKVKAGDLGGYIESEDNLSQDGDCWVHDNYQARKDDYCFAHSNAMVYGYATVRDEAQVYTNAIVRDRADVYDNAVISSAYTSYYDRTIVCDNAQVYENAWVDENARIGGSAKIFGNAQISENADVDGHAEVYGNAIVCGDAQVYENAKVGGTAHLSGMTKIDGNKQITDYLDEDEVQAKATDRDGVYDVVLVTPNSLLQNGTRLGEFSQMYEYAAGGEIGIHSNKTSYFLYDEKYYCCEEEFDTYAEIPSPCVYEVDYDFIVKQLAEHMSEKVTYTDISSYNTTCDALIDNETNCNIVDKQLYDDVCRLAKTSVLPNRPNKGNAENERD